MSSQVTTQVFTELSIKGFQSLYDVQIPLTQFTAVVGPSSSGKSAVVRALKLLTQNARGASFISHGLQQCEVTAKLEAWGQTVTIRRGKVNEYEIAHVEGTDKYTKLGGDVPEDVKNFLGIDPELAIASQFDPPYLLTSSGAEVARTLGSLTNVEVLFSAAREANRRKLSSGASQRALEQQIDQLESQLTELGDLDSFQQLVEAAEARRSQAEQAQKTLTELTKEYDELTNSVRNYSELTVAELQLPERELFQIARSRRAAAGVLAADLAQVELLTGQLKEYELKELPDVDGQLAAARELAAEIAAEELLLDEIEAARKKYLEAEEVNLSAASSLQAAEELLSRTLAELGVCPTCGQTTDHLHA